MEHCQHAASYRFISKFHQWDHTEPAESQPPEFFLTLWERSGIQTSFSEITSEVTPFDANRTSWIPVNVWEQYKYSNEYELGPTSY